jgi:hypothetical protein
MQWTEPIRTWHLRISHKWLKILSSGMRHCIHSQKFTDVLEEHTASIFRMWRVNQTWKRWYEHRSKQPLEWTSRSNEKGKGTGAHIKCFFHAQLTLLAYVAYSLILKMEAVPSSETMINFNQITPCHIPKDRALNLMRNYSYYELGMRRKQTLQSLHWRSLPTSQLPEEFMGLH